MECMFCPAKFETKEIPAGNTELEKAKAMLQSAAQSEEGEKWEHVQVTVTRHGARHEVLSGYTCPNHPLLEGGTKLVTI